MKLEGLQPWKQDQMERQLYIPKLSPATTYNILNYNKAKSITLRWEKELRTNRVTTNFSIDKVTAKMNRFILGCMHIDGKSTFIALPHSRKYFWGEKNSQTEIMKTEMSQNSKEKVNSWT